ncbi:unnamed protein product, partial [Meganyctiphanes norvegica]
RTPATMHSLVVILVLMGVALGAPQGQPGYNIQAPTSNSLQPGGGVSLPSAGQGGSFGSNSFGGSGAGQGGSFGSNSFGGSGAGQGGSFGSNSLGGSGAGQGGSFGSNSLGGSGAGQGGSFGSNSLGGSGAGQGGSFGSNSLGGSGAGQGGSFGGGAGAGLGGGAGGSGGFGVGGVAANCADDEVLHVDGKCVKPVVSRNIFVYAAPAVTQQQGPAPEIPKPKVEYNIVFVRTPEQAEGAEPIIIPPPQQKTLVYVLSKKGGAVGPQVIEVPAGPGHQPEVYYVNYADGENPTLPGGVDLQQALSAAATTGQIIGGGGAGAGIGGGAGGSGGFGVGGGAALGTAQQGAGTGVSGGELIMVLEALVPELEDNLPLEEALQDKEQWKNGQFQDQLVVAWEIWQAWPRLFIGW